MRNGGDVFNHGDFESHGLERADGGFTARSRAFDADFNLAQSVGFGFDGGALGHLLRGVGGAFAGALKASATGAVPTDWIALHIGDGHQSVIERGLNVNDAMGDILRFLGLNGFDIFNVVSQQIRGGRGRVCLLYTSPSPRDVEESRMPSSA